MENKQELYARAFAFNKALMHVTMSSENDPRKRERARSKVAMRKLDQWYEQGKEEYDRTKSSGDAKE